MPLKPLLAASLLLLLISGSGQTSFSALAQDQATAPSLAATTQLSQDQIRDLIREAAAKDIENDKKQRDYTYIQREDEHNQDGKGQVKSSESRTYDIMVLYEEPVRKLIA